MWVIRIASVIHLSLWISFVFQWWTSLFLKSVHYILEAVLETCDPTVISQILFPCSFGITILILPTKWMRTDFKPNPHYQNSSKFRNSRDPVKVLIIINHLIIFLPNSFFFTLKIHKSFNYSVSLNIFPKLDIISWICFSFSQLLCFIQNLKRYPWIFIWSEMSKTIFFLFYYLYLYRRHDPSLLIHAELTLKFPSEAVIEVTLK